MSEFKSGIILETENVLSPKGIESYSSVLKSLNIPDDYEHSTKMFVRAKLIPPNGSIVANIQEWEFIVDQDVVPAWFLFHQEKYERSFRQDVEKWIKKNLGFVSVCGYAWTPITDGEFTYYIMYGHMEQMNFGPNNNYSTSTVRKYLRKSDLHKKLRNQFGEDLCHLELDLTALDGYKDYGIIKDDILAIPTIGFLMEYGDRIPLISTPYWLSTPHQTPARGESAYVAVVDPEGDVNLCGSIWDNCGVRPYFKLRSDVSVFQIK